ncbi:copper amine oxidase [Streptomyces sp. ID05-39B]|uniref:copper amine oxidase n=1 Tax=Streptomyces sp. ID05-39B TaxID=3028664 RepID=UPI0029ABDA48|nr:copper amine oxidase [Streptomyces sp. ID05-39B]MDX3532126.1 copper amine oxidase [Streptomyces sp. ID05-39B]
MRLNHPNGGHRPLGTRRARRGAALGLSVVALAAGASATGTAPATAHPKAAPVAAPDCSAAYRIQQKLSNGTTWSMCWRFESKSGLVLEKISYQPPGEARPIRVLNSAKLAQIHVPYDDGSNEYNDITDYNFGAGLVNMTPAECPGGTIKTVKVPDAYNSENPNIKGLCTTTRARGHAYRMQTDSGKVYQSQGKDLLVYTVNKVSWYEYITEWRFADDGTVSMNVGATGSLSPFDYDAGDGRGWPIGKGATSYSTSHNHNVFWRLDFGLDGSSKNKVEQYDSVVSPPAAGAQAPTNKTTRTPVTKELAGDAKNMRWWRVVSTTGKNKDGHPRSYEIVPGVSSKYPGRAFTRHDVYFTQYNKCEQYANNNLRLCAARHPVTVDKWVNGQALTHPVAWVNVGFHHVARDEDQQPMPVHWQGFSIVPRDVTAMNPLTPPALVSENGRPRPQS